MAVRNTEERPQARGPAPLSAPPPLRIAVIGTGGRAQAHLSTIPRLHDAYSLRAVCDVDPVRAQEVGARYGVPGYSDVVEMLERERPQVALIAVPPDGHHILTVRCAERGVHVLCETPIATTLPCADIMIQAAREHGIQLEIAENVWRFPTERLKRRIIEAGLIGEVTQVHCWYTSGSYHGMNAVRTHVGSEATRVVGYSRSFPTAPRGEPADWELGLIDFTSGAMAIYQWPIRVERGNYWEIDGTRGQIIGSDLFLYDAVGKRARYPLEAETADGPNGPTLLRLTVATDPPVVWENPYREYALPAGADDVARADQLFSLYHAVVEGLPVQYGAENARRDQEILIALRESASTGSRPLVLPLAAVTAHEQHLHARYHERYGHDPLDISEVATRQTYPRRGVKQTIGEQQ
jgi:predicted dehydrogenase